MVGQVRGVNRAQLGAALRALRVASGKEAEAVARSALMSPSKLSKIENVKPAPSATDAERVLTAIGVSDQVKAKYTRTRVSDRIDSMASAQADRVHKASRPPRPWKPRCRCCGCFSPH